MSANLNPNEALACAQLLFEAIAQQDIRCISGLLADDVILVAPLSMRGDQQPEVSLDGKGAVTDRYFARIVELFSRTALVDLDYTLSLGGTTVFAEAKGDLVVRATGAPYRNVYLFKLTVRSGKITDIREYSNPITFARALGLPLA